jgi:hypothetical protein
MAKKQMNIGQIFVLDQVVAVYRIQQKLRKFAKKNLKCAEEEMDPDEALQCQGQADAYEYVADELEKMLKGQKCFEGS